MIIRLVISPVFAALAALVAGGCSRPASYEQFIRAEEAQDGVYEFFPGLSDTLATYDISFYTAPLSEGLQLEVTWMRITEDLVQNTPLPHQMDTSEGVPGAISSETAPGIAWNEGTGLKNGPFCTRSECLLQEVVWFPAGKHRALYRSGIPPVASVAGTGIASGAGTASGAETASKAVAASGAEIASGLLLQVKPIDPPGNFRGLGIICKRNDGTR